LTIHYFRIATAINVSLGQRPYRYGRVPVGALAKPVGGQVHNP
jgi:hypothetical protein